MQALQKKQKTWVLLLLGALLGLAAFLCLYGTAPLDPANDAWIWYGYDETDIHQHYAGWLPGGDGGKHLLYRFAALGVGAV